MCAGPSLFLPDPERGGNSRELLQKIRRLFRGALKRFRRLDPAVVANTVERIVASVVRSKVSNVPAVVQYRLNRDLARREAHRREHEALADPLTLERMAGPDPDSQSFVEDIEWESLTEALKKRMDPETRQIYLLVAQRWSLARIARETGQPERTLARHFQLGLQRAVQRLRRDSENARRHR